MGFAGFLATEYPRTNSEIAGSLMYPAKTQPTCDGGWHGDRHDKYPSDTQVIIGPLSLDVRVERHARSVEVGCNSLWHVDW